MATTDQEISTPPTNINLSELEYPETVYVRDIENRVFQSIVLQVLSRIDGIGLLEGTFIDNVLGRKTSDSVKGIHAEQDNKSQSVGIKVEVNVRYGVAIPKKAEEIQSRVAEEVTKLTGLHVSYVHVVFKNILPLGGPVRGLMESAEAAEIVDSEYSEELP